MPDKYYILDEEEDEKKEAKKRKIILFSFVVLGAFLLFFSFRQLKGNIYRPLYGEQSLKSTDLSSALSVDSVLQKTDTDKDSLSDYDELYVHSTSPYLEDTDSDGISDYDEIMAGTDPLCAEGDNCYASQTLSTNQTKASSTEENLSDEQLAEEDMALIQGIINGEAGADTLRSLLISNGFNEADLDQISDEDLQAAYFEVVSAELDKQEAEVNN